MAVVASSVAVRAQLEAIAERLGVELAPAAVDRLMILRGLWLSQGRAINLSGASTDAGLLEHLGDGLAAWACASIARTFEGDARWLDVGSGGGFPALVIAAVAPVQLVLVEPRHRRAAFLEFALASIGHKSPVVRGRMGDTTWCRYCLEQGISADNPSFAIASSRAVFSPEIWLELGDKLVMHGGLVIAHLRPEQDSVADRAPALIVDWNRSRIAGFVRPASV